MKPFAIDNDNNITVFTAAEQIPEGQEHFASEKELAKLSANWQGDRLTQIWNSFAGVAPFDDLKPVKKFTDRKVAVARIWKAVQRLDAAPAPKAANVAPEAAPPSKQANAETAAPVAREGSKKAIVLDMLRRSEGATLQEIMAATLWQAHSVRGFISGAITKKLGLKVESFKKENGDRAYKLAQ